MRPGEALGYDDPDPTVELARVPVSLLQDLLMERRKAKVVLVATLIDLWEVSAVSVRMWQEGYIRELKSITCGQVVLWPNTVPLS